MKETPNKPRKPLIAFLLSFLAPGLGQIYNGQLKKGIAFSILVLLLLLFFGLSRLCTTFTGFFVFLFLHFTVFLYAIIDAVNQARKQTEFTPKAYNKWYFYLLYPILFLGLYYPDYFLGLQSFHIPTTSQLPTILVGDRIMLDKYAYKNQEIDYGHIVAFNSPNGGIWSFRVLGLPNDRIELKSNVVVINGIECQSKKIGEEKDLGRTIGKFEETFPNGFVHQVYKMEDIDNLDNLSYTNFEKQIVPPNSYFLIGDYRTNARDSRFIGFIKKEDIIGRIVFAYWGASFDRIGIDFKKH